MGRAIDANRENVLIIGRTGENGAQTVLFDINNWREQYGTGVATLIHKRPGDEYGYPVATVETTDGVLAWTVSNTDTSVEGKGEAELQYIVDDVVVKSRIWTTVVGRSLSDDGEPPEPYDSWMDRIVEQSAVAEAAKDTAVSAASSAETFALEAEAAKDAILGIIDERISELESTLRALLTETTE